MLYNGKFCSFFAGFLVVAFQSYDSLVLFSGSSGSESFNVFAELGAVFVAEFRHAIDDSESIIFHFSVPFFSAMVIHSVFIFTGGFI